MLLRKDSLDFLAVLSICERPYKVEIHAPVWGRPSHPAPDPLEAAFQSTPPVWGKATENTSTRSWTSPFQSTPPCEGDDLNAARILTHRAFQSTPPVGGRRPA